MYNIYYNQYMDVISVIDDALSTIENIHQSIMKDIKIVPLSSLLELSSNLNNSLIELMKLTTNEYQEVDETILSEVKEAEQKTDSLLKRYVKIRDKKEHGKNFIDGILFNKGAILKDNSDYQLRNDIIRINRTILDLIESHLIKINEFISKDISVIKVAHLIYNEASDTDMRWFKEKLGDPEMSYVRKYFLEFNDQYSNDPDIESYTEEYIPIVESGCHAMDETLVEKILDAHKKFIDNYYSHLYEEADANRNGNLRKALYQVHFNDYAKKANNENRFNKNFNPDLFKGELSFVPRDIRYFYRLSNPVHLVIDKLVFFSLNDLVKANSDIDTDKHFVFGAHGEDSLLKIRIEDGAVVQSDIDSDDEEVLANSFDEYLMGMVSITDDEQEEKSPEEQISETIDNSNIENSNIIVENSISQIINLGLDNNNSDSDTDIFDLLTIESPIEEYFYELRDDQNDSNTNFNYTHRYVSLDGETYIVKFDI